ncbi:MAG: hypothetical protein F4206_16470 [Gammaproteobacteria bacterium]|nr:hypothetical protein [Gammaproteobacteria bacterium]MYG68302.1 hypothetical protein [Gammaproteobacteria bacterium]
MKTRYLAITLLVFLVGHSPLQAQDRPEHLKKLDNVGYTAQVHSPDFKVYYQGQARFMIGIWCQTLLNLLEKHSYEMTINLNKGVVIIYSKAAEEGGKIVREMERSCGKVDMLAGN